MPCSISYYNCHQANKSTNCSINYSSYELTTNQCDLAPPTPTNMISIAETSKDLVNILANLTTIFYTLTGSIKTPFTIYRESSHLSSLSQATISSIDSIHGTTPPIVVASKIFAISVTAVVIVSITLLMLFIAIIVLRRRGHFKSGR